jgi:hypothetical protein
MGIRIDTSSQQICFSPQVFSLVRIDRPPAGKLRKSGGWVAFYKSNFQNALGAGQGNCKEFNQKVKKIAYFWSIPRFSWSKITF